MKLVSCISSALFAVGLPLAAAAHQPSYTECLEACDFIGNAARSRDNGMPRTDFLGRLKDDILAIQSYPAHLRWFVQDPDDAEFLIDETEAVFTTREHPETHQAQFFKRCTARMDGRPT